MQIIYSPSFAKQYKKLPEAIQSMAEKKEKVFRLDPFDPRLRTHKLTGKLKDFWAFSIDQKYRIIFEFDKKSVAYFHSVGDHDIYKSPWKNSEERLK